MLIETPRLVIRPFTLQDADDVFEYGSQRGIGESAGWPAHESPAESAQILGEWIEEGCKHAIVLKAEQKVIGHISVDPDSEEEREDTRELGCALNADYHRRGLMTEAINGVLEQLFGSGIEYVWACCFQENFPSRGLIEKCGFVFQQEGEFYSESLDKDFDSFEYRLSKSEWEQLKH